MEGATNHDLRIVLRREIEHVRELQIVDVVREVERASVWLDYGRIKGIQRVPAGPLAEPVFRVVGIEPTSLAEFISLGMRRTILGENNTFRGGDWVSAPWPCRAARRRDRVWAQGTRCSGVSCYLCHRKSACELCEYNKNTHRYQTTKIHRGVSTPKYISLIQRDIQGAYCDDDEVFRTRAVEQIDPRARVKLGRCEVRDKILVLDAAAVRVERVLPRGVARVRRVSHVPVVPLRVHLGRALRLSISDSYRMDADSGVPMRGR